MNILHYIKLKLLQEGEAILPRLGTFTTSYHAAHLDNKRKELVPPSKSVEFSFSEDISNDSLIKYIAKIEKADYDKIKQEVDNFVSKIYRLLNRDQNAQLAQIGELSNKNNEIVFDFDKTQNFLPSSSGLKPVEAIPVKKEKAPIVTKKKTPVPKPKPLPPKPKPEPQPSVEAEEEYVNNTWSSLLTIFLAMIVIAAILLLADPFNFGYLTGNSSGLKPLLEYNTDKTAKINKIISQYEAYKPSSASAIADRPEQEEPEIVKDTEVIKKPEVIDKPITSSQDPAPPTKQFHIIIESSYSLNLARTGQQEWDNKGYNVIIIGPAKNGYYRLSLGQYNDKSLALEDLEKVRKDVVPDAWLLKY